MSQRLRDYVAERDHQLRRSGTRCASIPIVSRLFGMQSRLSGVSAILTWVELEPTKHPLAIEPQDGIGHERIAAVYHFFASREAARQ